MCNAMMSAVGRPHATRANRPASARRGAVLSSEEESRLAHEIGRGDARARDRMIEANLGLVYTIAREYLGRGLSMDDLVGEGNLGLIQAVDRFSPRSGVRFSTYAGHWIRMTIRKALVDTSATIRLPRCMVRMLGLWYRTEAELTQARNSTPCPDSIATAMGLSSRQRALVAQALQARRLNAEGFGKGDEHDGPLNEDVPDPGHDPAVGIEAEEDRRDLDHRLGRLCDLERAILALRFGLTYGDPLTLREVARRVGLSAEWVRRIEVDALRRLAESPDEPGALPASSHRRRAR